MVSSPVEIANLSLAKMGHEGFITSMTEDSKGARYMNVFYEPVRDELIRSHLWRFARKRVTLAPLVGAPPFDGGNYFQYPDDCLRIVGTDKEYFQNGERWEREGNKIIAIGNVLNLVYLRRVVNVAEFDPSFTMAFSSRLAYEGSMPITKSQSVKDQMKKELDQALIRAAHCSAVEHDGQTFISEAFIQRR